MDSITLIDSTRASCAFITCEVQNGTPLTKWNYLFNSCFVKALMQLCGNLTFGKMMMIAELAEELGYRMRREQQCANLHMLRRIYCISNTI